MCVNEDGSERLDQLLQSTKTGTDSNLQKNDNNQAAKPESKPVLLVHPAVVSLPVDSEDNNHFSQGWKDLRSLGGKHRQFQGEIPSINAVLTPEAKPE